jgi:type I restriction enzyme S subunit
MNELQDDIPVGYKQTEVGVIPEEWVVKPLADIADKIMVGIASAATHAYRVKGVPMFRNQNIKAGQLEDTDLLFIAPEYEATFKNKRLRAGDLLTMRTGYPGVTAIVPPKYDSAQGFTTLITRPNQHEAESSYLCHYVNSEMGQHFFTQSQIGGAQKNVNVGTLRKMPVPLPRPPEQRAITAALNDVDGLLGGLDRLLAKKRDLKQAAMQQLLTGQTRLPGFDGELEVKRLGQLAEMGSGGTPPSSVAAYYDGDIPWASISDMTKDGKVIMSTDRNLTREGFRNCAAQMFPAGTVLYAIYASLGECSIAGIELCSSQAILGIRPKDGLNGEFLYYFLASLKAKVKTLGQQGTQANLNKGMVQDFHLSLPPFPEQTAIAKVLTDMDAELAGLEQRRKKTRFLKQAMMQELLTGRTRLI